MSRKLISPPALVTNITNRVLSWFDRFVAYYNCIRETVKSPKNTLFDTCAQNSWRYEFSNIFAHTVVIRSENVTKHKTPRLLCTSVTNRLLRWFDLFTTFYNCISKNVTKLIFFRYLCTKVKNRVLSWFDSFTAYYNYISKNVKKLITPRDLYTSMTNRVPMWSDHFTAYSNCMSEKVTKLVSPRVLCTNVAKRVLTWFDRFTAYYNCMSKNVGKLISPRVLCTSVKKRVLRWFNRFNDLLQLYKQKCQENSYLRQFSSQISQIVFLADLSVLWLITTVFVETVKSPKNTLFDTCAQNSWRYEFSDIFAHTVVIRSENVTKLIFFRFLCTKVKNRVLSWFDSFTAYYNYISKNVKKLITPRDVYTNISQIEFLCDLTILRLILTVWVKRSQNSYLLEFCAQMSQNVFLPDLTVLRLITTVWAKMLENSYLHEFCAQVSKSVFLGDLTVSRLITTV